MKKSTKILVTKPYLPPIDEYISYLQKIWKLRHVTNNGPMAQELESKLKNYFGVKHVFFVSNGTIALQITIKALGLKKEIITTPFSFAASTTAITWENCTPIYADIDPLTLCIDPEKIEKVITQNTEAILAVHVYGIPCDVDKIDFLAKKYNLKVIYDAAHAFGTKIGENSIFNYGDISILSLHATKLFHTGEGGAIMTNNDKIAKKIFLYRNFGLEGETSICQGINGKNSEIHAALGLTNFAHIDEIIKKRKKIIENYNSYFSNTTLRKPLIPPEITINYAYYPVIFKDHQELLTVIKDLQKENIFPRRYFYPSLNTLNFVKKQSCPVSESVAQRILCLPLYHDLALTKVKKITDIIKETIHDSTNNYLPVINKNRPYLFLNQLFTVGTEMPHSKTNHILNKQT